MIVRATALAITVYLLLLGVVLKECEYLAPLKATIWSDCWKALVGYSAVLLVNLFVLSFWLIRRIAFKHTGDKLTHLERQLRSRETISEELTERILRHP